MQLERLYNNPIWENYQCEGQLSLFEVQNPKNTKHMVASKKGAAQRERRSICDKN